MEDLIALHTGQTADKIREDSDIETWFSAEDAKAYGLVDHVVASAGDVTGEGGTA